MLFLGVRMVLTRTTTTAKESFTTLTLTDTIVLRK
nr:MAG TPA: hypothetical protein [Caudoviricetes sp.]